MATIPVLSGDKRVSGRRRLRAGVEPAIVTNNVDPDGMHRVKVRLVLNANGGEDGEETGWLRIVTPMAGNKRGLFILPEVGDEVLVAFQGGDVNNAFVLGAMWNGKDETIYSNKGASGAVGDASFHGKVAAEKNDVRSLMSRGGHQLVFNDNADEPRIALHTKEKHRIVLDDNAQAAKIEIYDGKEENYILIDSKNKKITIETKTGDLLLKAKKKITLEAENIETKSSQNTKMEASQNFEIKAGPSLKASATAVEVTASGSMKLQGHPINLN